MELKKLCICFWDNDYSSRFKGVLETISCAMDDIGGFSCDKEQLAQIINELIVGCTLAFGMPGDGNYSTGPIEASRIKEIRKYTKITANDILINDEVTTIEDQDHDGGWCILNTNLKGFENNCPIYAI